MRTDMTPALTYTFCVLYLTSCGHPQRSASMLDTSPPPVQLHISLYCILSFVTANDPVSSFVPSLLWFFCCAASEWIKWGRKWANEYHCLLWWDICTAPIAQAHLHETEGISVFVRHAVKDFPGTVFVFCESAFDTVKCRVSVKEWGARGVGGV